MADVLEAIETMPWAELERLHNERFATQLDYVFARSNFYQRKFEGAGITRNAVTSLRDLHKLPFTVKQELRESLSQSPPLGMHLAADPASLRQIQASSGTTGNPTFIAATDRDVETWGAMGSRVFYANGFRPGDWILHAYAMSRGFVGGLPNVQHLQRLGCAEIPLGAEAGTERLLRAIKQLRPIGMVATPSMTVHLGESASSVLGEPASALSIRKISVGGEPGGGLPAVRAHMEELWGADVRDMMGGADFGASYWAECEHKDGMHLCSQGGLHVEIINAETLAPQTIEPGTSGELVYTTLDREAHPLVRYRMGDIVEVVGLGCACGRTGYRIKARGRTDDMLIVRGVNVFPSAIKDVVIQFQPRTTGLLKVLIDFPGHTTADPLTLKVEHSLQEHALETLKVDLERRIRDVLTIQTRVELVTAGTIEPPGSQKEQLIERLPAG